MKNVTPSHEIEMPKISIMDALKFEIKIYTLKTI